MPHFSMSAPLKSKSGIASTAHGSVAAS